jgi:carbamoyl-phosphate synthase large subunit
LATAGRRNTLARPRVLVLGAGSAPGISCIKALRDEPVDVLAAGHAPYMPGLYLVDRSFVLPPAADPTFADALRGVVDGFGVSVIIPTIDDDVRALDRARSRFTDVRLAIADRRTLEVCLDKWCLYEHLRGRVPQPATRLGGSGAPAGGTTWPLIAKPRRASAGDGVREVASRSELGAIDDSVILQELLPGPEVSVDVYANRRGHVLAAVPRVRLNTELGVSVCGRTVANPELQRLAREVAGLVGLRGIANIQFKEDTSGRPRLLEVNARCPGGMALTVASGVNMPAMAVQELLGSPLHEPVQFEELAMVRYREEIFLRPDDLREPRESGTSSADHPEKV